LLCLIAAGCSGTSKSPVSVNDQPANTADTGNYTDQYPHQHARSRLKLNKQRGKTGPENAETVWDRLLSLYSLPEIENDRINQEIEWYLEHPTSLAIIQQRAEPYLHHILDEIEAKNIPGELAYCPL